MSCTAWASSGVSASPGAVTSMATPSAASKNRSPWLARSDSSQGIVASAFLVAGGMSHAEALAYLRRARPIIALNAIQQARLAEWEGLARHG